MKFCEQCAALTRKLAYEPAAEPHVELMSGSLIWPDEYSMEWCVTCIWGMRAWFHLRYEIVIADPVSDETLEAWRQLEREYPDWPLFRPERCSSENGKQVRRLVARETRKACIALERLDRDFRKRKELSADNVELGHLPFSDS